MAIAAAILYFVIAMYVVPKNRNDVPFKQFGIDQRQVMSFLAEFGFYEASAFEVFKTLTCQYNVEYGQSNGWCNSI